MRILLAEDEAALAEPLREALRSASYAVDWADNGTDAQHLGQVEDYDAVILDLGLPGTDGLSVLQAWRREGRDVPVMILTARDHWSEKVAGIDAGADDYLAKPFHTEELLARLRALIRRHAGSGSPILQVGDVALDTRSGRLSVVGQNVPLTSHEYKVLAYLMHHANAVVSRTELTEHIYEQDFDRDSNTIEVFIGRLRKKLPPGYIETLRGMGYRLNGACPQKPLS